MKLTKKLETAILKTYNSYWENYLNGDVEAMHPLLADEYTQVGSAESEVFSNKKEAVQFLYDTIDQVAGKLEMRNRVTTLEQQEHVVLIHEFCDLYALANDNWIFYSKFRASTFMQQKKEGWKIIHQHSSFPDTKAEDGQNIAIDKIAEENQQLREAIKRRTVELEQKNKELEIETSLERVRAEAMGMKKPDDILAICKVMFTELQSLGFSNLRNSLINFWDDESSSLIDYDYSHDTGGNKAKLSYSSHPVFEQFQKEIKKSQDAFAELVVTKDELESWKQRRRDSGEYEDPRLNNIEALYYYFYSIGVGAIGISTFSSITKEQLNVLKRFRNVFDFAYRRYADVAQAEAQSREAQIELGLERVRARAMAMQNSDELSELVDTFFKELTKLDFALNWCIINIIDAPSLTNMVWAANPETNKPPESYLMKFEDFPFHHSMLKGYQERKTKHVYVIEGKEKKTYDDYLFNKTEWRRVPKAAQAASRAMKRYVATFTFSNFGGLQTVGEEYLFEENVDILSRFGKVFDLTYTRFNDLQKAEAQANEAKIEAALERVRSQSMGMQTSTDLSNVTTAMFEQLRMLGGELYATGIVFCDKHEHHVEQWHSVPGAGMLSPFIVPVDLDYIHQYRYDQWKKGIELFSVEIPENFIAQHFEAIFSLPTVKAVLDDFAAKKIPMPETPGWEIDYGASFRQGYILVSALQPFGNATILPRFAKVFEQTYTRFLDLQKAEAQTREAQINLAVERVRARALAMYKSDEILELVFKLKQEMMDLDIPNVVAATIHLKVKDGNYTMWDLTAMEYSDGKLHQPMVVYYRLEELDPNLFIKRMWVNTASYFLVFQDEEDFKRTIQFLRDHDRKKEADESEAYLKNAGIKHAYHPTIPLHNGRMCIDLLEPPSAEMEQILTKMGAAFDLAYKRFEDLKNSEAQLKEAQIEAALERVRSRSMAMHKSEELKEVIKIVYEQLRYLKINLAHAGFVVDYMPGGDWHFWIADEQEIPSKITHPWFESVWANQFNEAKEKGADFFATHLDFEEKNKFYNELLSYVPGLPEASKDFYLSCPGLAASTVLLESVGLYIENFSGTPYSDEENTTLLRFGKVFQQSYTRFLDLQKAEEQTREAKIEVSLERVRSRAMAMHKTGELLDAAELIYRELSALEVSSMNVSYAFVDGNEVQGSYYSVNPVDGKTLPFPFVFPHTETDVMLSLLSSWKKQEPFNVIELDEKATLKHQTYIGEHIQQQIAKNNPEIPFTVEAFLAISPKKAVIYNFNFTQGYIFIIGSTRLTTEQEQIMLRFTKVFELTYRRFLDLKQAEAQAREAQIELALERVRARTMAMQHSEELQDTSLILFQQLKELGEPAEQCTIGIIKESEGVVEISATLHGNKMSQTFRHKLEEPVVMTKMFKSWKDQQKTLVLEIKEEELQKYNQYRNELVGKETFPVKLLPGDRWIIHIAYFSKGMLALSTNEPRPAESLQLLERFAVVFEQTYTRFLDLQKAEAQAREAQIENALEKVRSRTMAMQKSEELPEAANVLFLQVQSLGIPAWSCGYNILAEDKKSSTCIMSSEGEIQVPFVLPLTEHWSLLPWYEAIQNELDFFVYGQGGEDLIEHYKYLATVPGLEKVFQQFDDAGISLPANQINHLVRFTNGFLLFITYESVPHAHEIFKRFGKVFEQTYTRFLDLQKAEAQTRESQIELGLERVRARAMAMQNSEELKELIGTVSTELSKLHLDLDRCFIMIYDVETLGVTWWMSNPEEPSNPRGLFVKNHNHPPHVAYIKAWKERKLKWEYILKGVDKKNWDDFLFVETELSQLPEFVIKNMKSVGKVHLSASFNNFGCLNVATLEPLSDEHFDIMLRFAKVFDLTYTRFNDLQKAEAQAREAKIEAALEKVRSSSMAMHKSNELHEVITVVTEQFQQLGFQFDTTHFITNYTEKGADWWVSTPGVVIPEKMYFPSADIRFFHSLDNMMSKEVDFFTQSFSFEEKNEFFDFAYKNTKLKYLPEDRKKYIYTTSGITFSSVVSKNIVLSIANYQLVPYTDEENAIIKKIGKVFEQSYTRFLDLQKAEAQAKEAQIEAALERVRSKTMAMHNSNDVGESVAALFDELTALGLLGVNDRCGIGIMQPNEMMELWTAEKLTEKTELTIGHLNMQYHTLLKNVYQNWLDKKETYEYILEGNDKLAYYEAMRNQANYKIKKDYYSAHEKIVHTDFFFKEGCLYVFSLNEFTTEATSIFIRFVNVFSQTYRRYLDLQKAEAQARESQIEAALEKVRSRTLAMQKSDELAETAAEVFRQLISLGIEPNRLYIGIVKEETGDMEMWATDEDGTHVGKKFMFNKNENASVKKLFDGWQAKEKSVIVDMQGKELEEYFHYLNNVMHIPFKDGLTQKRRVQSVAYFSKGFIGMASPDGQGDQTIQLLERFAAVFNLTFTRFNDLKIAEAHAEQAEQDLIAIKEAKQKAEEALNELQSTQKQLIQSEKMASLGELTAGIAHEIQNPLNFVNNFSEVSNELLDEMMEEVAKGNYEEVKAIADDVKQNLEKINHHGRRADGIVKGMLQHSRSTSASKEPTDINKLADEYLRLAYHGLRAKDKTFNAIMKTDYDESIGSINIIPQDMGRVILNLITNAFYVVTEKKNQQQAGYEPTVSVSTKKIGDNVEVSVKDNGKGIPPKVFDKIFQPFFTTKPTGQGTGLGLSLSYDIVKAHGGELKVETKEGEGSEFIIQLSVV